MLLVPLEFSVVKLQQTDNTHAMLLVSNTLTLRRQELDEKLDEEDKRLNRMQRREKKRGDDLDQ
jgi:hypothetical protein